MDKTKGYIIPKQRFKSNRKESISIIDSKTNSPKSSFTFFSPEGDTLPFNRVDKNNRNIAWIVHSNYKSGEFDVNQGNSLTFWFDYGYSPSTIKISKSDNRNYNIYLQREFLSKHFNDAKFLIKRNKLIELATKEKYVHTIKRHVTMGFAQVGQTEKHQHLCCYHQQFGLRECYQQTNK